jgi:hypothetical protein
MAAYNDDDGYEADGYEADGYMLDDNSDDEMGLSNRKPTNLFDWMDDGLPGLYDGFRSGAVSLEELTQYTVELLIIARYRKLYRKRVAQMFKNLIHAGKLTMQRFYPTYPILNNYIKLLSYKNRLVNYKRSIQRQIIQLRNGEFRILLAIPPRHACFGMNPTQLGFPHCIDAFSGKVYRERINRDRGVYEDGYTTLGFYWWIFEFTLTQPDYLRLAEMFDILISYQDISTLKSKPIFSWRSALNDVESYIAHIEKKHKELTGSAFTERPTSSQKNARHRKRNKRRLQSAGISLVY